MEKINYRLKEVKEKNKIPENLGFGKIFTDHMFVMDYNEQKGWHNPVIQPVENLSLHPAAMFFHYGQGIFEGLKAFKTASGEPVIFRPEDHIRRFNNSAKRLCIPEINPEVMLNALIELISLEKKWIPENKGESMYIRPFAFGVDPFLGVKPASRYKLIILLSPVGAYYAEGFKPVKILVQNDFVRAVRKGMGECKFPGNYAASLLAQEKAHEKGFTQVLWLDGVEQKYIEEVGTMNIFIRFKDEIATPELSGSILPGMTRDSVLRILKDWGMKTTERLISIDEVISEYDKGNVLEIFGTGTAAVISSVGLLNYMDKNLTFGKGEPGELAVKLFNEITSIQYGEKEDSHGWLTYVEKVKESV